ncbi:CrpP-related protein [Achromobacter sp. ACM02]|uniref:CrpP-related protein n=1 Tax=Achromobacter sp. ACM02 TaxID=2769305 RepID=UPI00351BECB7
MRDGATLSACPHLKPEAMPGDLGEAPALWRSKFEAWQAKWIAETKIRQQATANSHGADHKQRT